MTVRELTQKLLELPDEFQDDTVYLATGLNEYRAADVDVVPTRPGWEKFRPTGEKRRVVLS